MGDSGRSGTASTQFPLQQTLARIDALVLAKPGPLVAASASMKFHGNEKLIDDDTKRLRDNHRKESIQWTVRLTNGGEFVRRACEMAIQTAAD